MTIKRQALKYSPPPGRFLRSLDIFNRRLMMGMWKQIVCELRTLVVNNSSSS